MRYLVLVLMIFVAVGVGVPALYGGFRMIQCMWSEMFSHFRKAE